MLVAPLHDGSEIAWGPRACCRGGRGRWYVHITQDLVDALGRPFSDFSFSFILRNHKGRGGSGGHWVTCG